MKAEYKVSIPTKGESCEEEHRTFQKEMHQSSLQRQVSPEFLDTSPETRWMK